MKKDIGYDCVVCQYCTGAMTTAHYHSIKHLNSKRHKNGLKARHQFNPTQKIREEGREESYERRDKINSMAIS